MSAATQKRGRRIPASPREHHAEVHGGAVRVRVAVATTPPRVGDVEPASAAYEVQRVGQPVGRAEATLQREAGVRAALGEPPVGQEHARARVRVQAERVAHEEVRSQVQPEAASRPAPVPVLFQVVPGHLPSSAQLSAK